MYTHLVIAIRALLLALWGSRLRGAIGSILLSLALRIVGVLSRGTLGGACDKYSYLTLKLCMHDKLSTVKNKLWE